MNISAMNRTSFNGKISVVTDRETQKTETFDTDSILEIENEDSGYSVITRKTQGKDYWNKPFNYIESVRVLHPIETVLAAYNASIANPSLKINLTPKKPLERKVW